MTAKYQPARAGETREIPTPVLDTLYRVLNSARIYLHSEAEYLDARNCLDDLAQSTFTVRDDEEP